MFSGGAVLVVGWHLYRFVGGLDPSGRLGSYAWLYGRIWNPPLRGNINFAITQGCPGRRRLAAHNERRHPAELARSCGSMPQWGIDRCAPPQRRPLQATPIGCNCCKVPWRGQDPSLRDQWVKGCRGEQCSPGEFGGDAGFLRASTARPYKSVAPLEGSCHRR